MVSEIDRTATPWEGGKRELVDAFYFVGVNIEKAKKWAECLNSFSEEPLEVRTELERAGVFLKVHGRDCRIDFTRDMSAGGMTVDVKYDDGFLFQDCTARGELTRIELDGDERLLFSFEGGKLLGITKDRVEETLQIRGVNIGE